VGYLIQQLLSQQPAITEPDSNFHSLFRPDQSFLNFSFLDHSMHSLEEEHSYARSIDSMSKIVLGHFRDLKYLYQHLDQPTLVNIKISPNTVDLLVARVLREAIATKLDNAKYNDIRGNDWPETSCDFDQLPKWIKLEIESGLHKMFHHWNAQVNCTDTNVCTITTDDVFNGTIVDQLADHMKKPVNHGLVELHKNYQQLIKIKYNL